MESRIKKSLFLIVSLTLLISYAFMIAVVYNYTLRHVQESLKEESDYIIASVEVSGDEYLRYIDEVQTDTRITRIAADGEVLYDSIQDEKDLENHADREEVKEAFENGAGSEIRQSDTISEVMIYYAVRMDDGTVLRVSKTMDTAFKMALSVLPFIIFIGIAMAIAAWFLTKHQVKKLIQPIDEIDLEEPMNSEIYEELHPLLERIDKQNKEKEKNAQMRREFSANVSHELKTPLTSISGYAEIMMNGLVRSEDMPEFSKRIYDEASRMKTLIGDIIRLSKLDEQSIELEKEEVDLYGLARDIVSRLHILAVKQNVSVELVGEHTNFYGIRAVLTEMIYNLCENAIKYNKEHGSVYIWVGQTLNEKKVIISDTGIGIPEEHRERIFERFYRVDKSHSRETGGTGLGLSIVKHGAHLHGAEIKVISKEGEGTTMELIFPIS